MAINDRQRLIQHVMRPSVLATAAYGVASVTQGYIKLDAMESPYRLPESIRDELAERVRDIEFNRYPSSDPRLLNQSIRKSLEVPEGAGLMLGNGSDELIHLLIQASCQTGDKVLAPIPSFVMYDISAQFNHAEFVGVPLLDDFQLDLPAMLEAIKVHQPKIVFLAVPNNPTGTLWDTDALKQILSVAPGLVVIDEAYQPFAGQTWMSQVLSFDNLVVMRTVSKIGLAGVRLGYLAAHPDWVEQFNKVRPPYNVNVLTQEVVICILNHKDVLDEQAAKVRRDREQLAKNLSALPSIKVYPSSANFLLLEFLERSAKEVDDALKARKILVRYFGGSHPVLQRCLRVSIGTAAENAAFLEALQEILAS